MEIKTNMGKMHRGKIMNSNLYEAITINQLQNKKIKKIRTKISEKQIYSKLKNKQQTLNHNNGCYNRQRENPAIIIRPI